MKKQAWLRSIASILCLALLLPGFPALADNAPSLTLVSPQSTGSAAAADQQVIWTSSAPVTAQSNQVIAISDGTTTYSIPANDSGVVLSGGQYGPWSITVDMNRFHDAEGNALSVQPGVAYAVTVAAGAFATSGGTPCAETPSSFTLDAPPSDAWLITYVLPQGDWSIQAVASDGTRTNVPSGTTVPANTTLTLSGTAPDGRTASYAVTMGGTAQDNPNTNALIVKGDTHIVVTLAQASLSGTASIKNASASASGSYTPAFGDTVQGVYEGSDVAADANHLVYAFNVGGNTVSSGASNTYTITENDVGKALTLTITSTLYTGSAATQAVTITKQAAPAAPAAPEIASSSANTVTLKETQNCEYSLDGKNFQTSPVFYNLSAGQSYTFYQRYQETATVAASAVSAGTSANIDHTALTGTVNVSGAAQIGSTLTAVLSGGNNTGTLTYTWKRNGTVVGTGATYTPATADIGSPLTVEVTSSVETGALSATTSPVGKVTVGAPTAPTVASSTANSVTLGTVSGCEYSIDGVGWQDSPTFSNLVSGQTYTFYQRYKATDMLDASAPSAATFTVSSAATGLTGTVTVTGDVRYGKTLVAALTGSNSTGTLSYTWYRGATAVGTGASYDVNTADIGYPLYVQVVSSSGGSITKLAGTVQKSEYVGIAPTAPTRESRSTSRVTLTMHAGYEYSRDGETWQSSNVFSGLSAGKTYTFYQRVAETATMAASPRSDSFRTATSSASSSSDSSGSSSSGSTATAKPTTTAAPSSSALYSYTTTADSTRILFSQMELLVNGNKTQDVTITSGDVQFRFFKGTMQLKDGALWYDFGVELNGAELMAAAKAIAGDSVVATIHFNHSGELPAKANIRIALDAAQAGKALYYYRLENNQLTYVQTAIADISGAVTVVQSSCSDYVLLDRDFYAAATTAEPSASPEASASPTPVMAESGNKTSGGGWFIALIIIAALMLIVIGILFYLKSRQANSFTDEFDALGDDDDDPDDDDPDGGPDGFLSDDYTDDYGNGSDDPYQDVDATRSYGANAQNLYTETLRQPYTPQNATYAPPQQPAAQYTPFSLQQPEQPGSAPATYQPGAQYTPAQPSYPAYTPSQPASAESASMDNAARGAVSAQSDDAPIIHAPSMPDRSAHTVRTDATQHDEHGKYPRARYRP